MPKITIIDGNSLLFRAYYATALPGAEIMRNKDGIPTNAIFAFSSMINKIINNIKTDESIFVAFDAGKHNFRHEALETYKANRKPAPEELVVQFPIAREFLKAMGIYQFEEEGFEGDDIAGTVAKLAEKQGYEVNIYTSDKDFLQLVTSKISVTLIKRGLSDVKLMTPEVVRETFGFDPKQIIDYKGLRGDSSDNLPGIPGVGDKTAVKLIEEYQNFDNIISHADEIKGKLGESIKQNQDLGRLCRDLAIIQTDIALPFTLNDVVYKGYDFNTVSEFCNKYGFKQYMTKISSKWKKADPTELLIKPIEVKDIPDNHSNKMGVAVDYENDNYTRSSIYGISVYFDDSIYYIKKENITNATNLINALKSSDIKKYCYNYKAIKVCLANNGFEINGLEFDLLIAAYLIDSNIKDDVENIMALYGIDISDGENGISLLSTENIEKSSKIAYFSTLLSEKLLNLLNHNNVLELYNTLEIPLASTLAKMEIEGFPINIEILDEYGNEFKKKLKILEDEIYEMAGEKFNLASPKQVSEILFVKLGLKSNKKMSTSFDVLKYLVNEHPIVAKLLEYRKYFKQVTTYVDGLKQHVDNTGKVHGKFNQTITTTGRLSSSDPNMQNISVRDDESKCLRKAFTYPDDNVSILSLDYSQIELRILAALSNCKELQNIFNSGLDIHNETAKKIFNLHTEPTPLQRRKAKTVNFGIVYGISDWGLADELGVSVKESKDIINNFYAAYPEIAIYFQGIISKAEKDGYVSTLLGRRRYLRELHDGNYQVREFAKRAAMNAPIQGTAADLIKLAMVKIDKSLEEGNFKTKMVLQIHDELILKVYNSEKDKVYNLVKDIMENSLKLNVKFEVDGGFGKDWYEAK